MKNFFIEYHKNARSPHSLHSYAALHPASMTYKPKRVLKIENIENFWKVDKGGGTGQAWTEWYLEVVSVLRIMTRSVRPLCTVLKYVKITK